MFLRFCLLFIISLPAFSYNLTRDFIDGFYWASLPINIVVVDNDPTRKALITNLSREAIGEWERRSGLKLWNFTESGGTSNIIRWSTNFAAETRMDPISVLAVAIRYTNGPYFAKTEIIINGDHSAFQPAPFNADTINLRTTLIHELGHTMGLDHSHDMSAIMAPTLQPYFNLPSVNGDDISGIKDAVAQMEHRQVTNYVSPLSYSNESQSQPLSCATVGPVTAASSANGFISLAAGMLIGLLRKVISWFKSF